MAKKKNDAILIAGAVGAGLLLMGAVRSGKNGDAETCSQQVDAAQAYAEGASGCADDQYVMGCPHGDVQYTAVNTCERNYLENKGWTVDSIPGGDTPPDDEPPSTDPVEYQFQILSDSTVGVDYTLHLGSEPVPLTPPAVQERYQAETVDTVDPQYASETIQQRPDGTWLITGHTGSSDGAVWGDSFAWTTTDHEMYGILGWSASRGSNEYVLEVNGTQINPGDMPVLTV